MAAPAQTAWRYSQNCDVIHKVDEHAPTAASALATLREPWRSQFGGRRSTHRAGADVERVPVLSFLVHAKIKIDLKYAMLNGYGWNFMGDGSVYKGSILHSCLSFEILCRYFFRSNLALCCEPHLLFSWKCLSSFVYKRLAVTLSLCANPCICECYYVWLSREQKIPASLTRMLSCVVSEQ